MLGLYCTFADKCQYAHGKTFFRYFLCSFNQKGLMLTSSFKNLFLGHHELREKPTLPPASELPEEIKNKLISKAKALPGYKTKLCHNYESDGICQYDEMCHYAHGEDELREETEADREMAIQGKIKKNPFYKTIMCKSIEDCQYGENCVYAHTEDELRSLGKEIVLNDLKWRGLMSLQV